MALINNRFLREGRALPSELEDWRQKIEALAKAA